MSIFLANNPKHTKIQRQYWAIFKFGTSVEGCMRFCMLKEQGSTWETKQFEAACMLDDDDWVGPSPNVYKTWNTGGEPRNAALAISRRRQGKSTSRVWILRWEMMVR
jgi:hypothetical protein